MENGDILKEYIIPKDTDATVYDVGKHIPLKDKVPQGTGYTLKETKKKLEDDNEKQEHTRT